MSSPETFEPITSTEKNTAYFSALAVGYTTYMIDGLNYIVPLEPYDQTINTIEQNELKIHTAIQKAGYQRHTDASSLHADHQKIDHDNQAITLVRSHEPHQPSGALVDSLSTGIDITLILLAATIANRIRRRAFNKRNQPVTTLANDQTHDLSYSHSSSTTLQPQHQSQT